MDELYSEKEQQDSIMKQEQEILKLEQEIRDIIDEIGIDEFCIRMRDALKAQKQQYIPGCKYIKNPRRL